VNGCARIGCRAQASGEQQHAAASANTGCRARFPRLHAKYDANKIVGRMKSSFDQKLSAASPRPPPSPARAAARLARHQRIAANAKTPTADW